MNPLQEPDELLEAECNAQGLYGLPEPLPIQQAPAAASGERCCDARRALPDAPDGDSWIRD